MGEAKFSRARTPALGGRPTPSRAPPPPPPAPETGHEGLRETHRETGLTCGKRRHGFTGLGAHLGRTVDLTGDVGERSALLPGNSPPPEAPTSPSPLPDCPVRGGTYNALDRTTMGANDPVCLKQTPDTITCDW